MEQEEKRYSILDELNKSKGYDIALMTTFNFEIDYFERTILNTLFANDIRKVSIFVDSKELAKSLKNIEISSIGRKYMVNPISINSSFHPKVILLLGERKAKLFVGSANLKTSGFAINNEIFNFVEYSPEQPEYLDVIVDAIDFFIDVNEVSYKLDNDILKESKEFIYYHKSEKNPYVSLLHNMKQPILDQVQEIIGDEIQEISIAVPYYDNELNAYKKIEAAFENAEIKLYIQNEKSTFPVEYNKENQIANTISVFAGFRDGSTGSRANFYHGKVFLFKSETKSYILYGSSNCTQAALVKSFAAGGNIECDLFESGDRDEFDHFFENIDVEPVEHFKASIMQYESEKKTMFTYKYGVMLSNRAELLFSFSERNDSVKVYAGNTMLKHEYIGEELIVYVEEELFEQLNNVFELRFEYKNASENHSCWVYSKAALEANRVKQSDKKLLDDFDINSDGDKYIEDRCNVLRAELTCLPEIQEHKKKMAYYNQIKQEQEGDDAESGDFIVEVEIPNEYRIAYKEYHAVSRIRRQFLSKFLVMNSTLKSLFTKENDESKRIENSESNVRKALQTRKATSEEKKFERFIKSKVRGMLDKGYVEIIEPEHYLGLAAVIFEIFDKYNKEENVEDLFELDYVIKTKTDFLINLLEMDILGDEVEHVNAAILEQSYIVLAENYAVISKENDTDKKADYEAVSKALLNAIEKKYQLRSAYRSYIEKLYEEKRITGIDLDSLISHIERLYGYKNLDLLKKYIADIYHNANTEIKGKTMLISGESEGILQYAKPNVSVLREIQNFSRSIEPIDRVKITIVNLELQDTDKNNIVRITHSISLQYHSWTTLEIRRDGSKSESKSQYLSF